METECFIFTKSIQIRAYETKNITIVMVQLMKIISTEKSIPNL